jgi:protein AFG1
VAKFDFNDLADDYLGAADFIAICRHFHSIVLTNVPVITMDDRN